MSLTMARTAMSLLRRKKTKLLSDENLASNKLIPDERLALELPAFTVSVNVQLSPEGEVNSGGHIPRCEVLRYISTALHRP